MNPVQNGKKKMMLTPLSALNVSIPLNFLATLFTICIWSDRSEHSVELDDKCILSVSTLFATHPVIFSHNIG